MDLPGVIFKSAWEGGEESAILSKQSYDETAGGGRIDLGGGEGTGKEGDKSLFQLLGTVHTSCFPEKQGRKRAFYLSCRLNAAIWRSVLRAEGSSSSMMGPL